jgi:hypothetical protein
MTWWGLKYQQISIDDMQDFLTTQPASNIERGTSAYLLPNDSALKRHGVHWSNIMHKFA